VCIHDVCYIAHTWLFVTATVPAVSGASQGPPVTATPKPLPSTTQGHCTRGTFQCASSECITSILRCNGASDCRDGSDELNCGTMHGCLYNTLQIKCIDRALGMVFNDIVHYDITDFPAFSWTKCHFRCSDKRVVDKIINMRQIVKLTDQQTDSQSYVFYVNCLKNLAYNIWKQYYDIEWNSQLALHGQWACKYNTCSDITFLIAFKVSMVYAERLMSCVYLKYIHFLYMYTLFFLLI